MMLQYKRTWKLIEVLNDLVKIHNDRIAGYLYALNQSAKIDSGLSEVFEEIILDSTNYKQQLTLKIKELHMEPLKGFIILGTIYKAWTALKVSFPGSTQKAIIQSCLYNEEIALHAYNAALSSNIYMTSEIRQLIENQEHALKKIHAMVNKYREFRHRVNLSPSYFA